MKNKETLEEAAEKYGMDTYPSIKLEDYTPIMKLNYAKLATAFKYGAKWQAEQDKNKFSEEDMRQAHFHGWYHRERLDDMVPEIKYPKGLDYEEKEAYAFEQFKKK